MDARRLILRILASYDSRPRAFDRILDSALRESGMDQRDRRFVFEIACGVIRMRLTLDYVIDQLLDAGLRRRNATLRRILQMGVYQILYMDRVPDHAAVNESVKLAKAVPDTRSLGGVVNGVLRRVIERRRHIGEPDEKTGLAERLSIEFSHPTWLVERWLRGFGLGNVRRLLAFNNEKPDLFLRRRIRGLSRRQFEAETGSICDTATGYLNLYYRLKKNIIPENVRAIRQGLASIQAPSSGWVVALLEAERGDKILDVCSSPGGKAAMLSELADESGSVCACDIRLQRLMMTVDTARRMHLDNVYAVAADGCRPPFDGVFDKVLVDAPCSATGVMHRHPEARWMRKDSDFDALAATQRRLLASAANLVGPGGTIVYATCSLEPEENALQVQWFLRDYPHFSHIGCPASIPQSYVDNSGYLFITPFAHGIDGMFGARLRRMK